MHVSDCDRPEFPDEIPFKGGGGGGGGGGGENVRPEKITIFGKNGKIVILVKTRNFSRFRMTKWILPLESSLKI